MNYAAVRLRGSVNMGRGAKETMRSLNLLKVNHCVIVPESMKRMLVKAGNWVAWGEVSPEAEKLLKEKRGGPVFRLSPPSKGLRSTKHHFPKGDLGYRGSKINDLLRRML